MSEKRQKKKRGCLSRMLVLILLLALCAAFLRWSNQALEVERFTFASERLPAAFDGTVLVQLSDLHGAEFGEGNEKLLSVVAAAEPDYILITGDLTDRYRGLDETVVRTLADALCAIAPTYYVTGNHEWALGDVPAFKQLLRDCGVTVLSNEYTHLEKGGASIVLAGIDDPNGRADQKTPEELAAEVHAAEGDPFWLLLAHRNDRFASEYSLLGADLTISGHGHGGIIRLPFTDGLLSTNRTFFPDHTAGFYEDNGHTVFVSRGLGNSGPSFRVFNRPEVAVLTLRCK